MTFSTFRGECAPDIADVPAVAPAQRKVTAGAGGVAARHVAAAPAPDGWPEVKTLLEIGLAIVRVVEIVILFA